jgi:hypothetical protein
VKSLIEESPKKRPRMPTFNNMPPPQSATTTASIKVQDNIKQTVSQNSTPTKKKNLSQKEKLKSFASTPKSERKPSQRTSRVKELIKNNSLALQRNLSNSWADILDELEEQSKELETYVDKVVDKYKLEREKVLKNLETDPEVLRKRHKKVMFGKTTPEYERYIIGVRKKDRKPFHPHTPNKFRKCSRRKFDGLVKIWRKRLHDWDENPSCLENKTSRDYNDEDEHDVTECSNITGSNFSYIVDDYDMLDDEIAPLPK